MKLAVPFLVSTIAALCAAPKATVGREEAWDHLIGSVGVIRTSESRHIYQSVLVQLTVDTAGRVVGAEALDSPQFADQAVAIAKALSFRPFRRNGVAVDALVDEHVPLLPPEKVPTQHVAFPEVTDLSSVTFSLRRTECFGSCPIYEVTITGDGLVSYSGAGFVAVKGKHTDHIPIEKVRELLNAFRQADFYSLEDRYHLNASDGPASVVGLKIGSAAKTVTDYLGDQAGMPLSVTALENKIDGVSGDAKWLKGDGDIVSSLRREGFDFKSDTAGLILNRIAASGDEEAVLDLINAGAPIWVVEQKDVTALSNAASSGKVRAVNLLIQHGADPKQPFVLMEPARSGSPAVLRRILESGADAKANLPGLKLLLFDVVSKLRRTGDDVDRGAVVRLLVEAGADPNARNEYYDTPLHGDIDPSAARALIDAGANVNARNKDGATPLMWTSSELVAEMLLDAGADISLRSREGKTALEYAHGGHNAKIVELIEKASHSHDPKP